jgi:peptidoglycan/xylan/chitin deacetylase (PgdA/CDA1 family)
LSDDAVTWPNGANVAVAITVMFEAWSDGAWPSGQAQRTTVRPGVKDNQAITWGAFGGHSGVWRLLRLFDTAGVPATFCCSGRTAELYPDAIAAIGRSRHDIAGHGYVQDELLAHLEPRQQADVIRRSLDLLEARSGARPKGWVSPVLAWTEHTDEMLAAEGVLWRGDANDIDLPRRVTTGRGAIAHIPYSEYADYRVLWLSPQQYFDTYMSTFNYLREREPMSLLVLALHCHFGGRTLMAAMVDRLLQAFQKSGGVWFARHSELAEWALSDGDKPVPTARRFFDQQR